MGDTLDKYMNVPWVTVGDVPAWVWYIWGKGLESERDEMRMRRVRVIEPERVGVVESSIFWPFSERGWRVWWFGRVWTQG